MAARPRPPLLAALILAATLPTATARAQGLIVDRRPGTPIVRSFDVREVAIDAKVRDQVAEVQVSQTFHNPGSTTLESEYLFPLPDDGAIQDFVLMVDGRELPGELLPADEARRIYESIVRSKQDPALLEYMGRGLLKTRVFPIPPGADRKVTLRYTQLLKRDGGSVEFTYPLTTQKHSGKPIGRLEVDIRLEGSEPIKSVYCPSHDPEIRREGDREVRVKLVERDRLPSADFRLLYTLADGPLGASVVSYFPDGAGDGYFLLLASPDFRPKGEKPRPKTVVLVLDRSGSMSGKKIDQARGALRFVLDNLSDDDTFNVLAYDDRVELFRPELQRFTAETRKEALSYVDNIRPGGSTNIAEALREALRQVPDDEGRPAYVLFLTDGLPTVGETRELKIAEIARESNRSKARVFSFGVGFDVNARLLDRLGSEHGGTSVYVRPDEDIEAKVAAFASKLTSPALTGLELDFGDLAVNRVYPRDLPDLFEGGQLVVVGRYPKHGEGTLTVRGKVGKERQEFRFPVGLYPESTRSASRYPYVEALWAVRRVGHLIDQIDLNGSNRELIDELVALSKRHGILTPYTSFLADERVDLHAGAEHHRRAAADLDALSVVGGSEGVEQRAFKQGLQLAERLADAPVPLPAASGMGLGGFSRGAAPAAPATAGRPAIGAGRARVGMAGPSREADVGEQAAANVRRVGTKTFFRKGDRWVDSAVTPEQAERAVRLVQFGDAYFELARSQPAESNQYLTFEEPVTVELGGTVYRIDRAGSD